MAKPIQKERENRSAEKTDVSFHPYVITPENAHTAVILLESTEPEILCQTLRAMTKFSSQDMANRQTLFNLGALPLVLNHIDRPEINIRRFALKALAQLCQLPQGPEQVLANPTNLKRVTVLLAKSEDIFVQEFASLVLAELTREPSGCEQLLLANILQCLFNRMRNSPDPDVQNNCLKTLTNCLEDPICAPTVTKNREFSWDPLLNMMMSKYLAIQLGALHTVDLLIQRYKDVNVQKTFRASPGVLYLCDILESYEFRDVHSVVLELFRHYVETEENAEHVYQSGCILRLQGYLEMALPQMKPYCLAVLTQMANTHNGREALYETTTDLIFCSHLQSTNTSLLADAAMGVAYMTKHMPAAIRMCDTNIVEVLGSILSDDQAQWFYVRMNALRALSMLCRIIPKAAFSLVEPKTFSALRNINRKNKDNPIEAQRLAVECCINLLNFDVSRKAMTTPDFIQELLDILQRPDVALKINACKVLAGLMVDSTAAEFFTQRGGEPVIHANLQIDHVGLRTQLCILIAASVTYDGADNYLQLGTIHYMVGNKMARYAVSAWETALEAIFRKHPAAKFAYTGRLEINDFTNEGFYVLKRLERWFPTLEAMVNCPPPHLYPVLVAKFLPPPYQQSHTNIRTPYTAGPRFRSSTSGFGRLSIADDTNLRDYLTKLKLWYGDPKYSLHYFEIEDSVYEVRHREKCAEVTTTLKHRAQMLAEFVADQMSGTSQERDCSSPSVELHLADIMAELGSRVVGLGWVRSGGALERAVLYKVLADRLGLPCALVRTAAAHVWCEVAVPHFNEEDMEYLGYEEKYPAGLLRVNYVVDLTEQPGRLLPVGGFEASQLCGQPNPHYVSQQIPSGAV